jgi:hypothetical protein
MRTWLKAIIYQLLPPALKTTSSSKAINHLKITSLLSVVLISLMILALVITFEVAQYRFIPSTRSLNLHPATLLIFLWGGLSVLRYYHYDIRKDVYFLLPGIIVGGGFFLGLTSFVFELAYPNIIFHTNIAVLGTLLTVHLLNAFGVLEKYKGLEHLLIIFGSCLMYATLIYGYYLFSVSMFMHVPELLSNPLGVDLTIISCSLIGICLMSILALFHLNEMKYVSTRKLTFEEQIHIAANSLFIIFMLYFSFLALFAVLRKKK